MTTLAVLQSNSISWKGYFAIIHDADFFIFHDDLQFTKNDWRNRNKIKTSLGGSWLSIPVGIKEDRLIYLLKRIPNDFLQIPTQCVDSREFHLAGQKQDRLLNQIVQNKATRNVSGPAAKNRIDPARFRNRTLLLPHIDWHIV